MFAYRCFVCGFLHGWSDHPKIAKVVREVRTPMESVWWCPKCNTEHRDSDGGLLGQVRKRWEVVDEKDFDWMPVGIMFMMVGEPPTARMEINGEGETRTRPFEESLAREIPPRRHNFK